jgi:hypothetical protein
MKILHHWRTVRCPNLPATLAPELHDHFHLHGFVDGKPVHTSRVVRSKGREVWTRNTHYRLGEPAPEFEAWLADNGLAIDEANPVKLIAQRYEN